MRLIFKKYFVNSNYFYDIFLQGGGNLLTQIVSIISLILLTKIYNPSEFGEFNLFTTVVSFLSIFISLRYEYLLVLIKESSLTSKFVNEVFTFALINSLILFLFFFINLELNLFSFINLNPNVIIFSPISAFFLSIALLFQNYQQYHRNYNLSSLSEIYNKSLSLLISVFYFFYFRGFYGLAIGFTIGQLSKILFLNFNSKNILFNNFQFNFNFIKEYFKTALSFSFANFLLSFQTVLVVIFLGNKYGRDVVGHWSLMSTTLYLPSSLIGNAIGNVFNERFGKFRGKQKVKTKVWISTFKILLIIAIPVFSTISLCSDFLFPFVFGKEWVLSGEYSKLFAIVAGLSFVATPLDRVCYMTENVKYPYIYGFMRIFFMIGNIICSYYFDLSFVYFLKIYVGQVSILYLFDMFMSYKFASGNYKST